MTTSYLLCSPPLGAGAPLGPSVPIDARPPARVSVPPLFSVGSAPTPPTHGLLGTSPPNSHAVLPPPAPPTQVQSHPRGRYAIDWERVVLDMAWLFSPTTAADGMNDATSATTDGAAEAVEPGISTATDVTQEPDIAPAMPTPVDRGCSIQGQMGSRSFDGANSNQGLERPPVLSV